MSNQNNLPTFTGEQFDKVTSLIKWILGTIGVVFTAIIAAFSFFFYQNMQDMRKMVDDFSENSTNQVKSNKELSDEQIKRLTDYSEKTIGLISSETKIIAENEVQNYFDNHSLNDLIQKKLSDQLNRNNTDQLKKIEENSIKVAEVLPYVLLSVDKMRVGDIDGYSLLDSLVNDVNDKTINAIAKAALDGKLIDWNSYQKNEHMTHKYKNFVDRIYGRMELDKPEILNEEVVVLDICKEILKKENKDKNGLYKISTLISYLNYYSR